MFTIAPLFSVDGHQLMIITFACVIIFILIVCSVAIIAICVFVAIRHRQDSTEQEKLLKGYNKNTCIAHAYSETLLIWTSEIMTPP